MKAHKHCKLCGYDYIPRDWGLDVRDDYCYTCNEELLFSIVKREKMECLIKCEKGDK